MRKVIRAVTFLVVVMVLAGQALAQLGTYIQRAAD